tara:strand:- start:99 stop:347 length:249 start_codon:yes stop_codon:yes gene_type:complete
MIFPQSTITKKKCDTDGLFLLGFINMALSIRQCENTEKTYQVNEIILPGASSWYPSGFYPHAVDKDICLTEENDHIYYHRTK